VRLDLASDATAVRFARLAASDVAARAGFDVEEIEDLCRGLEELCRAVLVEPAASGRLQLTFVVEASAVTVEGKGTATGPDVGRDSRRLLEACFDEHAFGADGGPTFRARKARGGEP
jgi:anti-sigma regulatory factor (Ser/Thr protein kinase)